MLSLTSLIARSLANSLTPAAIEEVSLGLIRLANKIVVVLGAEFPPDRQDQLSEMRKIIWFGAPTVTTGLLHLERDSALPDLAGTDSCAPCSLEHHHTESVGRVVYADHPLTEGVAGPLRERPFTRFDFTNEWNNLGFGRIRTDGGIWAARGGLRAAGTEVTELASCCIRTEEGSSRHAGSYLALFDGPGRSVLWCDRPAGPVDSSEWTVVERFISDWRGETLPCLPCLCGTPAGCSVLVTMRLDCDEDISSARDLFEWYLAENLPFSMALKTSLPMTPEHLSLVRDVAAAGGSLLSHSHTHPFDWGGSYEAAQAEGELSRQWFHDNLPEVPLPVIAVSPFHTNPTYAMQGVEAAGFTGVVSGIIHNDPEYLLGRAGIAPGTGHLVTISEQSMLHGDCYAQQGSVAVHADALEIQRAARGIFGYLDHPFSARYQYGWSDKTQRLEAHKELVAAIRACPGAWFWSQGECFAFVRDLMGIRLETDRAGQVVAHGVNTASQYRPEYRLRGETHIL